MNHIRPLTGLRGIAALIVFLSHATNEGMLPWVFGRGFGQIGVMIFFVLSGFLMTHLYAHRDFNGKEIRAYAVARFARVVPLYLALLLISVIVSNFIDAGFYYEFDKPGRIIRSALFIDAPYVFWTIPVEVQFYAVFIGFWWLIQRRANPALLFAFAAATLVPSIVIYFLFDHKTPKIVSYYSYGFFIGAGTALIYNQLKANARFQTAANILGIVMLVLVFVNLPAVRERGGPAAFIFIDNTYVRTWLDPVSWIVVYGLTLCAALNARSLAILNWRRSALPGPRDAPRPGRGPRPP